MAGIYIHIPFCKKFCSYCDFYHVLAPPDNRQYIDCLIKEAATRREYTGSEVISTIYIGGGTPSVLSACELAFLMDSLRELFIIDDNSEFTIELNPDDITEEYLEGLKKTGVNRISLGVQSWKDDDLSLMNRRHNSTQAAHALDKIFYAGFENVSIDLIYGLPGMTAESWLSNLEKTFAWDIKHLSAYHLTVEPGTVLAKMKEKGLLNEPEEEESSGQFNLLIEKAVSEGFEHYEISNFGKPGYFSEHNTNYWRQVNYIGLGPSAHSFNGYSRQWNMRDLKGYIKAVTTGTLNFEREELDTRTRFNEYIMTTLRTMWGIDLEYVERIFEKEGYDYILNLSSKFIAYGLMKQDKKNLVLTNQGKMISDNIISELMLPGDE